MSGPPQHGGPAQPPNLGMGNNVFAAIMAGQGGQSGLAPPPPQDQQPPPHQLQQPPPGLQGPPPPPPPPSQPFGQQQYGQPPAPGGFPSQPPPSTASPGPVKRPIGRPPAGGPATPQISTPVAYPGPGQSPQVASHSTPDHTRMQMAPTNHGTNALGDVDLDRLPAHFKKAKDDWFVIFNQHVPRVLDVDLVHTLQHESVVCCVRFSADGKYVATGCNRSAQIYDVQTGEKLCVLQDDSVDISGDLYIRSVCFSPDGKYLATGAEDKLIRVWDIQSRTIRNTFAGHEQDIYSLDFARDGRTIASGSGDRTVRLWDIENGQSILTLTIEDGVTTVAISPDTKYVAAGSLDKSVRVWDIQHGYLVERLEGPDGHKDSVYSVAFSPNGKDLVSGSLDKTIKMWELAAPRGIPNQGPKGGRCVKTFEGHRVRGHPISHHLAAFASLADKPGFRALRGAHSRRRMGHVGFEGPRRPVLGSAYGQHAAHAARPQELGHLGCSQPGGQLLCHWFWRHACSHLGIQPLPRGLDGDLIDEFNGLVKHGIRCPVLLAIRLLARFSWSPRKTSKNKKPRRVCFCFFAASSSLFLLISRFATALICVFVRLTDITPSWTYLMEG